MLYSYFELCNAMRNRETVTLCDTDGMVFTGLINQMQIEDGSGNCWNVTMYVRGDVVPYRILFIRTYPH